MKRAYRGLFVFGLIFVFVTIVYSCESLCKNLKDKKDLPFKSEEKFIYKVKFNGIYVGKTECRYLGQKKLENKWVNAISLSSNVRILKLLEIESKENLFIDSQDNLPLKVERDVKFFGKQENILEEYNQKENYVKITKTDAKGIKEEVIRVEAPIHNVIALLYLFPKDIELKLGGTFSFVLPTQKINLNVIALEILNTPKGSYEAYVLKGQPRKFKVWLEKQKRIPLRIEFPVILGRITISLYD